MVYRVQCVDKLTGLQSDRIYRAESADRAAEMAMKEGYIVGHVFPEADVPMAPAQPGRLESYGAPPPKQTGLRGFFSFDVMIYPIVLRAGFIVVTVIALLASVAAPVLWLYLSETRSPAEALALLSTLAWVWGLWIGFRLFAESMMVLFSMREELMQVNEANRASR